MKEPPNRKPVPRPRRIPAHRLKRQEAIVATNFTQTAVIDITAQCDALQAQLDQVRSHVRNQNAIRSFLAAQSFTQNAVNLGITVAANAGLHE